MQKAMSTTKTDTLSGFTQRVDAATGQSSDTYVYSVRVTRAQWQGIDFQQLAGVDPGSALGAFGMRCRTDRGGNLLAVEPLDASEPTAAA